jgi:hypothetical protein
MTASSSPPSRITPTLGRSARAIALGFGVVVVLSLGTDELLHLAGVYPPWGEPMHEPALNALALSYRCAWTVLGMYLTARLAPHSPTGHALLAGGIGTVIGTAGAIATIPLDLGPAWYPIAVAVTALPCAWLGAALYRSRHGAARRASPIHR